MDEQVTLIGPVMKAARKFKKYNQADVAAAIGCSQSALSKMEHNLLVPSAPQWFLFSRFTSIPPESLETGVIDRKTAVRLNDDEVSLGYKLPKKYRLNRAEKVRELYPFLFYFEKKLGTSIFKQFIDHTGLDEEFFLDFDNLVNFQLFIDTIHFLIRSNHGDKISEIVQFGQNDIYWDDFLIKWKELKSTSEILQAYSDNQKYFQGDFKVEVLNLGSKVHVSYSAQPHLYHMLKDLDPAISSFLREYREQTLLKLIKRLNGTELEIQSISDAQRSPLSDKFEISI